MKTMPIIAQLRSTSGYDTDAPYVYLELDAELLARIEKAVSLYSSHQNDPSLGLSKLTIHGAVHDGSGESPGTDGRTAEVSERGRKHPAGFARFRRRNWIHWKAASGSVVKASTSLMPGTCMS